MHAQMLAILEDHQCIMLLNGSLVNERYAERLQHVGAHPKSQLILRHETSPFFVMLTEAVAAELGQHMSIKHHRIPYTG